MTDPTQKPIQVDPSISLAMLFTGVRQMVLIGGGAVTLGTLVRNHNFAGIVAWFQGNDFATTITALVTLGTLVYGQFHTFIQKIKAIAAAKAAPNSEAVVRPSKITWLFYRLIGKL